MKRIAFIIYSLSSPAGMERSLTARANMLCERFVIEIITQCQEGKADFFTLDNRIRRYDLGLSVTLPNLKRECKRRLSEYLKVQKFDVVVSLGGFDMFFLPKINDGSKKVLDYRFAYNIYDINLQKKYPCLIWKPMAYFLKARRSYYARKYSQVVVLSKANCEKWRKDRVNATYIYNPLTLVPQATSSCSNKIVLSVGRLDYQKGYDILIDAWELVHRKHSDWVLHIIGDGPENGHLKEQIERLGLHDTVLLLGAQKDVHDSYVNSSIYVGSSRTEAFGLVITEAEVMGLPIVTFASPDGPAEIVEHGRNGFVIEGVGNIGKMADYICQLIEDPALRRKMGKASMEVAKKFDVAIIKDHWINLFENL